ncbi:MAG TPA: carboxymuconolactone decarboxylase family protein [Gemmatimonadaceae bacterium]
MTARIHYPQVAPKALQAMRALEQYGRSTGLEPSLLELARMRVSYMNGCAYCIDMHSKDARLAGETEQRLYAVPVWRETPFFTPRERAALAWAEAVTELGPEGIPDHVYEVAREEFDERELTNLTMVVVAINGWNRLNVAFRIEAGSYQPAKVAPASHS